MDSQELLLSLIESHLVTVWLVTVTSKVVFFPDTVSAGNWIEISITVSSAAKILSSSKCHVSKNFANLAKNKTFLESSMEPI